MKIKLPFVLLAITLFFGCQKPIMSNTNSTQTPPLNRATTTSGSLSDDNEQTTPSDSSTNDNEPSLLPGTNVNQAPVPTTESEPPLPTPTQKTSVDLSIPFTSQAPYGVWDELHGEVCEEASMIMVAAFLNQETLTPHTADQAIISLAKWEEKNG